MLAVRLSETLTGNEHTVLSHNALGVAYFWGRNFDEAEQAFDTAIQLAEGLVPKVSTFQARVNLWWTELLRLFYERNESGQLSSLDRLLARCDEFMHEMAVRDGKSVPKGVHVTTEAVLQFALAMAHCWSGRKDLAAHHTDQLASWANGYGSVNWLSALEHWARAEIAWAKNDLPLAIRQSRDMVVSAAMVEHEPLACTGHLLASSILSSKGLHGEALQELQMLRAREQLIRSGALASRRTVVEWQVELRTHKESAQKLKSAAVALEKLAMEDGLTKIPNRRQFEAFAVSALDSQQLPCLALIDVDRFKKINDTHSHKIGDEVLKSIAQIAKSFVGPRDLLARLGGDEFVIVFTDVALPDAQDLCDRIAIAVQRHAWSAIAEGLSVSISVGVASAIPGDTVESLSDRSDKAMYGNKHSRPGQG